MDKAQEKIKAEYVRFSHQLIAITARVNATGDYIEIEAAEEEFYSKLLALIVPKDKPPLLSDEEIKIALDSKFGTDIERFRMVAQAQRDKEGD